MIIVTILIFSLMVSLYLYEQERQSYEQLGSNVLTISEAWFSTYFSDLQNMLQELRKDLQLRDGKIDYGRAQAALKFYVRVHPELSNITLMRADGQILLTANTGHSPTFPSMASDPSFADYLRNHRKESVDMGRPIIGRLQKQWLIPVRLGIYDDLDRLLYVLSANLPLSFVDKFWENAPITQKGAIGLMRDDGFLAGRHPVPAGADLDNVFGKPRTGALVNYLRAKSFPAAGTLEGPSSLDGPDHFITFKRLRIYPLTIFVSIPKAELYKSWWSRISGFYLVIALLFVASLVAYRQLKRKHRSMEKKKNQADEALRNSEEKFRLLVENSYDIIYSLSADGTFLFVSQAWTTLLGHPVSEVIGKSFAPFVHPDDLPGCMLFLKDVIGKGQRQEGVEYRVRHADGTWYWHTSNAVPFTYEAGSVVGFYGIARDITERKNREEAMKELISRLQKALDEIKTLRGIVPICANCKKVRADEGYWQQVEVYVTEHTEAQFSHGICPDCSKRLYPQYHTDEKDGLE